MDEKEFTAKFNQGYLLEQYHPQLSKQLEDSLRKTGNDMDKALLSGMEQYRMDMREPSKERDRSDRTNSSLGKGYKPKQDLDMDKG